MDDHDHDGLVERYGDCIVCLAEEPPPPPPKRTAEGGPACEFCETSVVAVSPDTYRLVQGWIRPRKGGGTNALRLATEQHRYACSDCVMRLSSGKPTGPTLPTT